MANGFIINRTKLKANMVLNGVSRYDLCKYLDITYQCLTPKLYGRRGFTENEISILYSLFGADIFLPRLVTETRTKRKEEE